MFERIGSLTNPLFRHVQICLEGIVSIIITMAPVSHVHSSSLLLVGVVLFSYPDMSRQECKPEYQKVPPGRTHTACKPPNQACSIDARGLSPQVQKEMLDLHNKLRSQVAMGKLQGFKPAEDMLRLVRAKE